MMTELKLHTYGEKLIVSEKVTISSGDINSAAIVVEFDECWDNYPARTAIFKNDKITGNIEVLMVDNKCTIPAEVLQKNGTLKISIRAASIDGAALKTSTKIRYTIAEGASPGTTTLTPTMDLYQQFLAALHGEYDPLSLKLKKDYNSFTSNVLNLMSGDVLWENPDITAEFPAQKITLDLTEYVRFKIVFNHGDGDDVRSMAECRGKGFSYHHECVMMGTHTLDQVFRAWTVNDDGIVFENAYESGSSDDEISNEYLVPVEIIGYKPEDGGSTHDDSTGFDCTKYSLPILYLEGDTSTMTKENPVDLSYKFKDMEGTANVKWQGSSSLAYPKKNYTIKFDTAFEAKTGWGTQKKYCLKANWIDFSHSRNIVAAKLWGECVRRYEQYVDTDLTLSQLPNAGAIDGFPVAVVINNEYIGLYSMNIPKDAWLFGMDEENVDHCIIGASGKNDDMCGFKTLPVIDDDNGFEFEHISDNATDEHKAALQTSIQNLYTALQNCDSRSALLNNVGQYLDIEKAAIYMVYTAHVANYDGLTKNYLLVKTDGSKWHMSAYDLDSTFGNNPYGDTYYYPGQFTYKRLTEYNMIFKKIYDYAPDLLYSWHTKLYMLDVASVSNAFYTYTVGIPKIYFDEEPKIWKDLPGTITNNLSQITSFHSTEKQLLNSEIESLKNTTLKVTMEMNEHDGKTAAIETIGSKTPIDNIWGGQTINI